MSELAGEQASLQHVSEEKEEKGLMPHPSLERIAERLTEHLRCEQEDLCRPIVQQITHGKPVASAALRAALRVNQDELEQRLGKLPSGVEFDRDGNIVGLGVTLVPTSHRVQVGWQAALHLVRL
jgi:alkylmercury lyase